MALKFNESLDTNTVLRLMLDDVPEQRAKVIELLCRPDTTYHIADLAITEAVYALQKYGKTRSEIVQYLEELMERMNIMVNHTLFERVFPMYLAYPELSFNDCCLAGYAALNQAEPLWTFDKALAKELGTAKLVA